MTTAASRWKIIGDAPAYRIDENGDVINASGHVRRPRVNCWGYVYIGLKVNGKSKYFKVHRLVAKAFIPNPENKPEVNHKDRNITNNHKSNLEWVTPKENGAHTRLTNKQLKNKAQ